MLWSRCSTAPHASAGVCQVPGLQEPGGTTGMPRGAALRRETDYGEGLLSLGLQTPPGPPGSSPLQAPAYRPPNSARDEWGGGALGTALHPGCLAPGCVPPARSSCHWGLLGCLHRLQH